MLTFSGDVWHTKIAKPLQPKWAARDAGPVWLENTYFETANILSNKLKKKYPDIDIIIFPGPGEYEKERN